MDDSAIFRSGGMKEVEEKVRGIIVV